MGLDIVNYDARQKYIADLKNKNIELSGDLSSLLAAYHRFEKAISGIKSVPRDDREFDFLKFTCAQFLKSKSQLFQDLFVLYLLNEKRNGFFVEFGATDGISLSNSYLMESVYDWEGIVCEPGESWHQKLRGNRNCAIDLRCVWNESGVEIVFNETIVTELSTIEFFEDCDGHSKKRKEGRKYLVRTVSLMDLLAAHNAPKNIDYLSIDTEGSEYEILKDFDFNKYKINIITVEHNFTAKRDEIYRLLTNRGYQRVFENISQWDDWYVRENLLKGGEHK